MVSAPALIIPPAGIKPPDTGAPPPKFKRRRSRDRREPKRKKCPYCLCDLTEISPEDLKETAYHCPVCWHKILEDLLLTPVQLLNRFQQWALLANELDYVWNWKYEYFIRHRDHFNMYRHSFRTTQYSDAKAEFEVLNDAKGAVLRLREEFLEAEDDFDLLICGYLEKKWQGGCGLAEAIRTGRPWRVRAVVLSTENADPTEIHRFQFELVKATPCVAYGIPGMKEHWLKVFEELLKKEESED